MARPRQPFARRLLAAFILMTAAVSGMFSLGIVAVVHFVEAHLVSRELGRDLDDVLQQDIRHGSPPRLDADTQFFSSDLDGYAIPPYLQGLKQGFTEVEHGDDAYYAYTRVIDGHTYILLEEQNEFERREDALFMVVLVGFLLSVLSAWGLGYLMARKVMAPVIRLASQVRHRDQLHAAAPPLAPEYANDEIGQLAAAFDSTLDRIRQMLERERLFAADASHELRTPLMIMASSCELLAEAPLGQREHEQVSRIARAVDEMRELVETFMQLARDKNNGMTFARTARLRTVAAEEVRRWGELIQAKGLDFEFIEEGKDDTLYNATLLRSVIGNLLRNALHYTEQGYVRLVLGDGTFRVEDSGSGIPPTDQTRIFEPFVRGSRTRGDGLGLGLSLVKRICTRQDWEISVHSDPGGGSCFRVSLHNRS
ncbi:MAG TPA: HAMP domain-containing sensor histidine kinase [Pseudomonadales bacterium]|nr:HAMP domain-containing sensor histidine kinase [Pseudomonadales bacterium]